MKLADLKKRLTPGTKLRLVDTGFKGPCDEPREVVRVRSKDVVLLTPTGRESFLDFPKAADFQETPDGFRFNHPNGLFVQYRWA